MALDTSFGKVRYFNDWLTRVKLAAASNDAEFVTNRDTDGAVAEINEQRNGALRITVATTDGRDTNVFGPPIWRTDQGGPVILEMRCTLITSLADGETYIGWTDDDGTDEMPITLSTADVVTTNASNAVGFAFTGAGTADWKAVSVNGDSDGAVTRLNTFGATTPVVGTFQTFRLVINEDGDADYFIDGIFHVREDAAVSASTLLAWSMGIQSGGAARSLDNDYVYISAGRV